ncbi:MAG: PEP-CTERM sorting domain-containing protein [Thiobacillus sp.]|nr:PEP-CTERM sorting domain-containing protein [Thiobacillus sp.]
MQSFPNSGGSESFVNSPDGFATPVPEAQTVAMMLAGLGLVGFMTARHRKA